MSDRGGALGELLFTAAEALFSTVGAHILFVFLMAGGILLVTGASVAGVVSATGRHVSTTRERVAPPPSACAAPPPRPPAGSRARP